MQGSRYTAEFKAEAITTPQAITKRNGKPQAQFRTAI